MNATKELLITTYPGASIESSDHIAESVWVDPGCEISSPTVVGPQYALCQNVHTIGPVRISNGVIIRENVIAHRRPYLAISSP